MKRVILVLTLCWGMSVGSFLVLLLEDRRLGVPLPYSVPVAYAGVLMIAAALLAIAQKLWAGRPVQVIQVIRPVRAAAPRRVAAQTAEGSVLLDFSKATAFIGHAA
jgi:hypothetical protein